MTKRKEKKSKKDLIIIEDWAGNVLFEGHCKDPQVLKIMRKNKAPNDDIYVSWQNEKDDRNVYEYIYF